MVRDNFCFRYVKVVIIISIIRKREKKLYTNECSKMFSDFSGSYLKGTLYSHGSCRHGPEF